MLLNVDDAAMATRFGWFASANRSDSFSIENEIGNKCSNGVGRRLWDFVWCKNDLTVVERATYNFVFFLDENGLPI